MLNLWQCNSLTALPDLQALTSLQTLNLMFCDSLKALPDLSALTDLKVERLPEHLRPWKAGGFKAWNRQAEASKGPDKGAEQAPRSAGCGCAIS